MSKWTFINDAFVSESAASLHISDLSIQRGYGIFDFFKVLNHTPVFLDEHLARFYNSARQLHLAVGKTEAELRAIITGLIEKNQVPDSGIRLTLTGGYSPDGYQLSRPNLMLSQHRFQTPTAAQFQKGIKLVTYQHQRQLPQVKSIDYLMAI